MFLHTSLANGKNLFILSPNHVLILENVEDFETQNQVWV